MKIHTLAILSLLVTAQSLASETFPGLKTILSEAEWKRAGLDRLSPDQIGVIDAALIRHHGSTIAQHKTELAAASTATPPPGARTISSSPADVPETFGLPASNGANWRDQPPLKATVTEWVSANRFKLDNGQVWEGVESVTYDIAGKAIEIHARPSEQFALTVEGKSTTLRVRRVR
jgi:hypothetical protein